jgi:hypothetical protein
MIKRTNLLFATAMFVVLLASACGGRATSAPQIPQVAPTVASVPTQAPAAEVVPVATIQSFAPACQAATTCSAPEVESLDTEVKSTYCVKKVPYQNILGPPGTIFQPIDPAGDFICQDSGTTVDGKTVLACRGKQLWAYQLKLSNPACNAGALVTGIGQCQEGFGYDTAQNCCAPLAGGDTGSVTIRVNLGACR